MAALNLLSATQLAQGIKNKTFSCREVIQAHLAQIRAVNPTINAIVQLIDEAQALQLADAADQQVAQGRALGPLHGVPVTVKDHIKVKDFIVTRGCVGLKDYRCTEDASIVARLKAAGAIVIGITNMPELGPSFETDNDVYGQTKNPYDLSKTPGGSSGGEAAIIACGGSALGLGSDGGGSIRVPAHFSGIAGIKPTQHLVSCAGNVPADGGLAMLFYTPGPMSRSVEDLQLALPILSGSDGVDPRVMPMPLPTTHKPLKELRIGYFIETKTRTPTQETIDTMHNALQVLGDLGVKVSQVDFLDIDAIGKFQWDSYFLGGDQGKGYKALLKRFNVEKPSKILQNFFDLAEKSEIFDAFEIRRRFFEADQIRMQALQHMRNYDVIISPACITPAKTYGTTHAHIFDFVYTIAFNLLGWPGTVVRCGESKDGLPIGLQIVAKPWDDYLTLAVAQFLEKQLGGWRKPLMA